MAYFVGPVPEDKFPKDATPGRVLAGTIAFGKLAHYTGKSNNNGNGGNGSAPSNVPFTFTIPPKKETGPELKVEDPEEEEKPSTDTKLKVSN